jgi:hypothetical protein
MPFEYFYKTENEAERRWLACLALAVALAFGGWLAYRFVHYLNERSARIERAEADDMARKADGLCARLPKPEGLRFVRADDTSSGSSMAIARARFRSERGFEEYLPYFSAWFAENGWKTSARVKNSFSKNDNFVYLMKTNEADHNFVIGCYEFKPKDFPVYWR